MDLQLLMHTMVFDFRTPINIVLPNRASREVADILFSGLMGKHLQSNDNSLHSFNQLMMPDSNAAEERKILICLTD